MAWTWDSSDLVSNSRHNNQLTIKEAKKNRRWIANESEKKKNSIIRSPVQALMRSKKKINKINNNNRVWQSFHSLIRKVHVVTYISCKNWKMYAPVFIIVYENGNVELFSLFDFDWIESNAYEHIHIRTTQQLEKKIESSEWRKCYVIFLNKTAIQKSFSNQQRNVSKDEK